jgi:hypothetical protein
VVEKAVSGRIDESAFSHCYQASLYIFARSPKSALSRRLSIRGAEQTEVRVLGVCLTKDSVSAEQAGAATNCQLSARPMGVFTQNLTPDVFMMQPAQDWYRCDVADPLRPPKMWSIFVQ